jgi:hypothetical protein
MPGPLITGAGGAILSGGAKAGLGGVLAGGTGQGVVNSVIGSALAGSAPELLKALFGPGGAARTNTGAQTTGPGGKFTITAQDVLALEQYASKENFRRRLLGLPQIDVQSVLDDTARRLDDQLSRASERKREEVRLEGELRALPQAFASMGQMGTAQSRIAEAALSKVLEGNLPAPYLSNMGNVRQITK